MIQVRFNSRDEQRKALGWLPGRFSFKSWPDGRMVVPDQALPLLALEGMSFVVEGPATKLFYLERLMPKTMPKTKQRGRDTYLEWVQRFPLKTIKNDDEHERAAKIISRLMGRNLDSGAGDYLDALIVLVNKYEDEHHAIPEDMTPREALRALMEANALSQAEIGRIIGSESAVSMFLKGHRACPSPRSGSWPRASSSTPRRLWSDFHLLGVCSSEPLGR